MTTVLLGQVKYIQLIMARERSDWLFLAREELKLGRNLNMHFRLVVDGVHSTLIAPTMTFLDDYCPAILSIRQHPLL